MTTWDYYMKLKDAIIRTGGVNVSGNPLFSFKDSANGVSGAIVYDGKSETFTVLLDFDYSGTRTVASVEIDKTSVERGLVSTDVLWVNEKALSAFEAVATLYMSTYNGQNASFSIKQATGMSGVSTSKIINSAQSSLKLGFSTWQYMLSSYTNGEIKLQNLGFTSYN